MKKLTLVQKLTIGVNAFIYIMAFVAVVFMFASHYDNTAITSKITEILETTK